MRRLLTSFVVAATTVLVPMLAAAGTNQEFAEQIAKGLRSSGQLHDYKIGVKYQDGTAWLKGQVSSEDQLKTAVALASQMPGVSRVVSNLTVVPVEEMGAPAPSTTPVRLATSLGAMAPESRTAQPVPTVEMPASVPNAPMAPEPPAVQRVRTSYVPRPVQQVSADEQEMPGPIPAAVPTYTTSRPARPLPIAFTQPQAAQSMAPMAAPASPIPAYAGGGGPAPVRYDHPQMPCHAWPSYAAYPNYGAVTYPRQYSPAAWPYIGPFYPYPQVPLGWRKVTLEWDDGWWFLDFKDHH